MSAIYSGFARGGGIRDCGPRLWRAALGGGPDYYRDDSLGALYDSALAALWPELGRARAVSSDPTAAAARVEKKRKFTVQPHLTRARRVP